MKVFIVTGEGFPYGMAAVSRIKCYARAIVEGGIDCEVVVYRRTEIYGKKVKNTDVSGVYKNVPFRYTTKTTFRGKNRLIRHYVDKWDLRNAKHYICNNIKSGDVLFLYLGGPIEIAMQFMKIAHSNGAYCIRDLCELPYGTGEETQKAIRLRKKTIETQFPQLDGIISISDTLLNLSKTYASPFCKHIKVPILVDFDQYYLSDKSEDVDVPFIFHAGTLYEQKDGFISMLEAFGKAVQRLHKTVKFISTGNIKEARAAEQTKIKKLIKQYQLENKVEFTGYISSEDLKNHLSYASIVIINKKRTQQNNYCFSTKLGEYMAAAKPVIITNVGEAMNWLEKGKNAYVIEPEDNDELADAIVHVFNCIDEARRIGLAGQEVCRRCFDYKAWSKPLVDYLNHLGN